MSYAGHVLDMIARIKYNRSLLKRHSFFQLKENLIKAKGQLYQSPQPLTKEQMAEVKKIARSMHRAELRASIMAALLTVLLLGIVAWWIVQRL